MDFLSIRRFIKLDDVDYFKSLPDPKSILCVRHEKSGDTAMHVACRCGSVKFLSYFIGEHGAEIECSNNDGKRPVHDAAQYSQEECISVLLNHSAHVDPLKRADWTPLMLACTKHSLNVVNQLIDAGADAFLKNKDGWNSFHLAAREGDLPIIQSLHRAFPGVWKTRSNNLRTPLHTAALHGHTAVVKWMLQACLYGTDETDTCGVTPLMDALRAGHVETAGILIDYNNADVTLEDKAGRQSVHQVAQSGQAGALEFLVSKAGVSVHTHSSVSGETPLHTACKEGQYGVIEVLVQLGFDIDARDKKGRSPLHIASGGQRSEIVKLLLKHGAQLLKDKSSQLPQYYARKPEVVNAFGPVSTEIHPNS